MAPDGAGLRQSAGALWPPPPLLLLLLLLLSVACPLVAGGGPSVPVQHIIIFGLDGLQVDVLHRRLATLPALRRLRRLGAHTDRARSVYPTLSLPNWAALLYSAGPTVTGIRDNGWHRNTSAVPPVGGRGAVLPNLFAVLKAQRPDITTTAFYNWDRLRPLFVPEEHVDHLHTEFYCGTCPGCMAQGPAMVDRFLDTFPHNSTAPSVSFLQFDAVDDCGHSFGVDGYQYQEISLADAQLQKVYNRLEALGLWDRTVMIVLSDHGREECAGRDHGGFSDAEVNTQWLAVGAGIRHGQTLAHSLVSIEDTAPTVLWALNLTWPMQWRGRPVWEAFEGAESGSEWWWYRSPQVPVQDRSRPACFQEDLRAHAPFLSTPCELWKPGGALRVDTAFTVEGVPYLVSDGAIWSLDPASGALFPASRSMNELVDGNVSSTFTCNGSLHFSLIDGRNLREGSKGPVPAPDLDGFGAVDAALEHPNETASVLLFKGKDIWLYSCTQGSLTLLNSTLPFNLMGVQAALSHRQTLYLFAGMQVYKTNYETLLSYTDQRLDMDIIDRQLTVYDLCALGRMGTGTYTCFEQEGGADFQGTLAYTKSGLPCQPWRERYPHASQYPWLPHNYCRNPDLSSEVWCYTTDPAVPREACAVGSPGQTWRTMHRCGVQCPRGCSVCHQRRPEHCLQCMEGHQPAGLGECKRTVVARIWDHTTGSFALGLGLGLLAGLVGIVLRNRGWVCWRRQPDFAQQLRWDVDEDQYL